MTVKEKSVIGLLKNKGKNFPLALFISCLAK